MRIQAPNNSVHDRQLCIRRPGKPAVEFICFRQRRSHKRRMHEDWLKAEEAKLQTANGEGPSSDASQEPTASSSQEEVALEDGVGSEPQSVEPEVRIPNSNLQA